MKIEVGESLIRSWLRHVEKCEFAELNWKPSSTWPTYRENEANEYFDRAKSDWPEAFGQNTFSQFLKQAEVDVLGLSTRERENPRLHLVDIAFHTNGLNYGSAERTGQNINKKLVRSALLAKTYFPIYESTIYFITPVITNGFRTKVEEAFERVKLLFVEDSGVNFQLILGDDFKLQIFDEVIDLSNDVADTSEIFLRSWQLAKPFLNTAGEEESYIDGAVTDTKKVLVVALYLSKFGHLNLNVGNQISTIQHLAQNLGVNHNTLRNYRDRFDRYVDNDRVGWDAPLTESLQAVLNEYSSSDELTIRSLISDIFV